VNCRAVINVSESAVGGENDKIRYRNTDA